MCVINICFCFYLSKNICNCWYLYLSMKIEHSRQRLLLECSSRITRRRFLVGVSSSSSSFSSSFSSSDFFVGLSDFFLDLSSQKKREAASSSVGGLSNTFPPTPTQSSIILPSYSDNQTPKPPPPPPRSYLSLVSCLTLPPPLYLLIPVFDLMTLFRHNRIYQYTTSYAKLFPACIVDFCQVR